MPKHNRYHRIKNHTHKSQRKRVKRWCESNNAAWIATEKLHGCNFSLTFAPDGELLHCSSRNRVLKPGDAFHGWEEMLARTLVAQRLSAMAVWLQLSIDRQFKTLTVFGELIGGSYPGVDTGIKPVQGEIPYVRTREFVAFDILSTHGDGGEVYLPQGASRDWLEEYGVKTAPRLFATRDPLSVEFEERKTLVPAMFGEDETRAVEAEGFVLVPNARLTPDERRDLVMKFKSEKFKESRRGRKSMKPDRELNAEENGWLSRVKELICLNRVNAVASKELEDIHPYKLAALVVRDALDDAEAPAHIRQVISKRLYPVAREIAVKR